MDVDSEGGKKVIEEVTKDQAQKKETGFYARNPKEADKEKLTGEDVLDSGACNTASLVRYPRIFLSKATSAFANRAEIISGNSSFKLTLAKPGW